MAKISELIAKQEALIGLLGERRESVITEAVTKSGWTPPATMKQTSHEALGRRIPE